MNAASRKTHPIGPQPPPDPDLVRFVEALAVVAARRDYLAATVGRQDRGNASMTVDECRRVRSEFDRVGIAKAAQSLVDVQVNGH